MTRQDLSDPPPVVPQGERIKRVGELAAQAREAFVAMRDGPIPEFGAHYTSRAILDGIHACDVILGGCVQASRVLKEERGVKRALRILEENVPARLESADRHLARSREAIERARSGGDG